ncbi:hypothetical protein LTR94_024280 [Friedmanniomyces endolithicus]|nr:hypothetical protein LTR94_024280 [Friedmanniomyces endolithicus]
MLIAIVAFVAAVAGVWAGRELFPSPPSPGVELHSLLHDGLELDEAQQTKLQMLESHFTVRRRALELELRADNARLAAAIEAEHGNGPQVAAAVDRSHGAMGADRRRAVSLDLAACTDGELAALTLAGRQAAFAEIMRRHQRPVYRLIRSHIGDAEEALDLTQECFVAAFQNLRKYDGDRPLAAWLTRVAINKSRDWHRRRRIRQILSFASSLPPDTMESERDEAPGADAITFDRAELARLSRAVSELPATLKETLLLRTVEGLSQAETAAALGISGKAVETRLRRARERLSKILDFA